MENANNKLETTVDRVVVYQQGANITRVGTIELEPSTYDVIIPSLPSNIDRDSIRVKGQGTGTILNINIKEQFEEKYSKEEIDQMEAEIKHLDQEIGAAQESISFQETKITKITTARGDFFKRVGGWYSVGEMEIDGINGFNDTLGMTQDAAVEAIATLGDQLEDLRKQREVTARKLQLIRDRTAIKQFWEVHVILAVDTSDKFTLEVTYQIREAGWQALYDAHVETGQVNLKVIANVWNTTDEDWNNVLVEVSTATLTAINAVKPTPLILHQYIRRAPARATNYRRGLKLSKVSLPSGSPRAPLPPPMEENIPADGIFAGKPKPAKEVTANVGEAMGVQSYKLPERISIPSEKTPHPVILTNSTLTSSKKLFWSATQPQWVLAQDVVTNGDLLLLPGKVKSYYEGEYVGETAIAAVAPKETFKLGSRLSYEVKITKKLVDRSREKQLVKGKLVQHYEYEFTVENLSRVDAPLKIYDRIPHSDSEKIKIETDFTEYEPAKKIKLGIVKWKMDLKGVETVTWKYRYTVTYDKDITIDPPLP